MGDQVSRPVTRARLFRKQEKGPPRPPSSPIRVFNLACADAVKTLHVDVELEKLDDGWRARMVIGGTPDIAGASGCEGPDQRAALLRLADWARRAAEGLALVTSESATITTEIVEMDGRSPEAE